MQNIEEDYGMFVWPCSVILAEYVWQQRPRLNSYTIIKKIINKTTKDQEKRGHSSHH